MNGLYDGEFVGFKITSPEELDTALREAVVAIDANVLLDLYRFRPQTSRDLIKTLKSLDDRLVVPNQALREFWRHRQRSQGSPRGATKAATDALAKSGRSMCDALATWAKAVGVDDEELSDLTARVDDFLDALKGELQQVLQDADAERAGDPILEQLEELLAGRVTSPLDHDEWTECVAEANRRIEAEEPPGYRDAEKQENDLPEGGAGDYLVWYQATRHGMQQVRDLIIVTRDEKEDWWWRHRSVVIGPRHEMTKEFFDLSGGRQLFLLRPRDLLFRSAALNVEINPASLEDAGRERGDIDPVGIWTTEAVTELLGRLDREGQVQSDVIRKAAALGGTISRDILDGMYDYDDERMLWDFTRLTARITVDLRREGLLSGPVMPILKPLDSDSVRISGFRVPPEVVAILRNSSGESYSKSVPNVDRSVQEIGKYQPLTEWLMTLTADSVVVEFAELEEVIDSPLPSSARNHLTYWYSIRNPLGKAIAAAGFKASKVNFALETATLIRRQLACI